MSIQGTTVDLFWFSNSQLSHAFVNGTKLVPEPERKPLKTLDWQALEEAERKLYAGGIHHSWTDINLNEGHDILNLVWEHAWDYCRNELEVEDGMHSMGVDVRERVIRARTARRVAYTFKILAFGPESVLI